jgi:outer membrane protein assembly factor BamB
MRVTRRVPILLATVVATALAAFAGCGWMGGRSGVLATELPTLQNAGLHQVWQRQVRLDPAERITKAWRVGESIYIATSESRFTRLDAKSGILKWTNALGTANMEIFKPIELRNSDRSAAGQVLVVTGGEAYIFNQESGDIIQSGQLGVGVSTDPVVVGTTLCLGGADTFYGMYLDRLGMKRWRIPAPGDMFVAAPLAMDGTVLFGSLSGRLWRVSGSNGNWDWKDRKTNGRILGGLGADYNAVYVPCEDQRVYAFASDTGSEMWETQLDNRLEEAPVLAGSVVLVTSVDRKMSALARSNGEVRWTHPNIAQVATVNENTIWVADTGGTLRLLSLENGEEKASAATTGVQYFLRNALDSNVTLITHAGQVGMYSPSATND